MYGFLFFDNVISGGVRDGPGKGPWTYLKIPDPHIVANEPDLKNNNKFIFRKQL